LLEDPSNLAMRNGEIYSLSSPEKKIDYAKLLRRSHFASGGTMVMSSFFFDPPTEMSEAENNFLGNISMAYAFGTQAVLVEVDEETGKIDVLKVVAVHDAGRILNPVGAEGQIEGGVVMALSYALVEQLILDEGMVMNPSFADYKLFTSLEMPEIKVIFVGVPDTAGPFGAKGLGEHGCIPTAAALANALYDALGVRLHELPLTPDRVLGGLGGKNRK
jgi:CO/xanthine dehydrogenase Mo-binding subunit